MPILRFPPPESADPETGLIGMGGDLHPQSLLLAYRQGIFPWPLSSPLPSENSEMDSAENLLWFCPDPRAILKFEHLHFSKSLEKLRKKKPFRFTHNEAFEQVMRACAETPRPGQDGTWITPAILESYLEMHRLGYARSVEAWNRETGLLVGGIYGLEIDGVFSAESMFYRESGASKLALGALIELLKSRGQTWMDIQMMTPHMEVLGAETLPRPEFLALLKRSQRQR